MSLYDLSAMLVMITTKDVGGMYYIERTLVECPMGCTEYESGGCFLFLFLAWDKSLPGRPPFCLFLKMC